MLSLVRLKVVGLIENVRNRFLLRKYPFWALNQPEDATEYSCTWYDNIPRGWRKAFGRKLSEDIVKAYVEVNGSTEGIRENVYVYDVKEKYGTLRIYASACDAVQKVLDDYEIASWDKCIVCGRKADYYTLGWIVPVCEKHAKDRECKYKGEKEESK